jgi:hypothetical protein
MESRPVPRPGKLFCFGLVSGLSLWGLELGLTFNAALWLLLALRGKLPARNALAGLAGFLAGYLPALLFNLTHHSSNWQQVFFEKTGGEMTLFHVGTLAQIFVREMPKFFGPDTVFWYYPETPAFGPALYLVALLAVAAALWPFLKKPGKIGSALSDHSEDSGKNGDVLMLALAAACFIPYLAAPIRVPGYYLGGIFPLSVLIARLVARCLSATRTLPRILGATLLLVVLASGVHALLSVGGRNQIETFSMNRNTWGFHLAPISGRDLEVVERHLRQNQVTSVWTTMSLVYPLVFESDETLAVSSEIFGITIRKFPPTLPERKPDSGPRAAFVVESDSPNRARAEELCRKVNGTAPLVTDCGALIIFEARVRPDSRP